VKKKITSDGILYCSGMIAGEGLIGILLAVLAIFGWDRRFDLSAYGTVPETVRAFGSLVLFGVAVLSLLKFSLWKRHD